MFYIDSSVKSAIGDLLKQQEAIILEQLGELVHRGLLVIESTQPVIVETQNTHKFELRQMARLVLKDQEYIEKLEKENASLRQRIETIALAINPIAESE